MRGTTTKLAVFTAATLIFALPVLSEAGASGVGMGSEEQMQKDECLLVAQNCRESVDSLQQRIDRLSREISKGSSVYSGEELRSLEFKLKDANQMMEDLTRGGA